MWICLDAFSGAESWSRVINVSCFSLAWCWLCCMTQSPVASGLMSKKCVIPYAHLKLVGRKRGEAISFCLQLMHFISLHIRQQSTASSVKIRVLLSSGNCCTGLGPRTIIPVSSLGWWWQQMLKKRAISLPCTVPQYIWVIPSGAVTCFYLVIYLLDQCDKFNVTVLPGKM